MISIRTTRGRFTVEHRRLNRARHLYLWLARHYIIDGETLLMVAELMSVSGLYSAHSNVSDIANSIMRRLYFLYFGRGSAANIDHWWAWVMRFGQFRPDQVEERFRVAARKYPFDLLPWQRS